MLSEALDDLFFRIREDTSVTIQKIKQEVVGIVKKLSSQKEQIEVLQREMVNLKNNNEILRQNFAKLELQVSDNEDRTDPQIAVVELSSAISSLINIYSRSFNAEFHVDIPNHVNSGDERGDSHFTFHLYAAHNLPDNWVKRINEFSISFSLIYSGRKIYPEIKSQQIRPCKSLFSLVIWDENITFPLPLRSLPYESMLVLKLCGVSPSSAGVPVLAWSCLPLFSGQRLVHGVRLLNTMSHAEPPPVITPGAIDTTLPTIVTVQVDFPEINYRFEERVTGSFSGQVRSEDHLNHLNVLVHRNSVLLLSEVDKQCLWHLGSCYNKPRYILPLVLGSAPGWDPSSISAMYTILSDWTFTDPLEALGLLNSGFTDRNIREAAGQQIARLPNDEMLDFLPQLVQAVKWDWSLDNSLVQLLLERSLQSIQVSHRLYWLLLDARNEPHYSSLYHKFLAALRFCAGKALNEEFSKQQKLIKILHDIAEKVKNSPDAKKQ
ncbi:phosphatidylinositol 3-kinase C2 domain-containing subunit gamma-like, partial [Rhinophrynus dorsalis]